MRPAVVAPLVDVVAGVEHEVELLRGDAPVGREVSGLEVAAPADREAQPIDCGAGWRCRLGAADLARLPTDAEAIEVFAAGFEAAASTWTLCPSSGRATTSPWSHVKRAILAISHATSTFAIGMPPPSRGSGASLVHSTTPSGSGSPEATPRGNG